MNRKTPTLANILTLTASLRKAKPSFSIAARLMLALPFWVQFHNAAAGANACALPQGRSVPHGWAPVKGPKPWIVCVDLNGDKIQDQVILIHDSQDIEIIAFLSTKTSFHTYVLYKMPSADSGDTLFLVTLPAGDTIIDPVNFDKCGTQDISCTKAGPLIVHLRAPTAALSLGETAVMFQWLGNGFRELWLSD
jgi:hypothetical protein